MSGELINKVIVAELRSGERAIIAESWLSQVERWRNRMTTQITPHLSDDAIEINRDAADLVAQPARNEPDRLKIRIRSGYNRASIYLTKESAAALAEFLGAWAADHG